MTDLVTLGETVLRLSPPRDSRIETASEFRAHADGPESNAAVAARRLGADAAWLSALPDTPLGRRVAGELRGHDVDVRVAWTDGRQGLSFGEQAAPPRGDVGVDDRRGAAVEGLSFDDLPTDLVSEAAGVYATSATLGRSGPAANATAELLKAARSAGALTAFGLRYDPDTWAPSASPGETVRQFFPAVDVFVADQADVEAVLDRSGGAAEVAHALASAGEFDTVALRREQSSLVWHDARVHEYPAVPVDPVDAAGAGDAFAGAFLARLLADDPPQQALKAAMAADALAQTVPGPVPTVTRAEVERVAADVRAHRE